MGLILFPVRCVSYQGVQDFPEGGRLFFSGGGSVY